MGSSQSATLLPLLPFEKSKLVTRARVQFDAGTSCQLLARGGSMSFNNSKQSNAPSGIEVPRRSRWQVLKRIVLLWLQDCGLLQAFGELRSCYYRIARPERIIGVPFEELRERMREQYREAFPDRKQRYPYMPGIETLCSKRPWLTWQDLELFLQGWFHAEGWMLRNSGKGFDTQLGETLAPCKSSVPASFAVLSTHEETAGQPRVCEVHERDAPHHERVEDRTPEAHGGREKGEAV